MRSLQSLLLMKMESEALHCVMSLFIFIRVFANTSHVHLNLLEIWGKSQHISESNPRLKNVKDKVELGRGEGKAVLTGWD